MERIEDYWRPTKRINYSNIYRISAKTNMNVEELCLDLRDLIDDIEESKRKKVPHKSDSEDDDENNLV